MATQVKPAPEKLYDEDFYVWSQEQAELLRAGRFDALDLEHLIEEVEDLGGSLERSVRSRARRIMEHLLAAVLAGAGSAPRLARDDPDPTQRAPRRSHSGAPSRTR